MSATKATGQLEEHKDARDKKDKKDKKDMHEQDLCQTGEATKAKKRKKHRKHRSRSEDAAKEHKLRKTARPKTLEGHSSRAKHPGAGPGHWEPPPATAKEPAEANLNYRPPLRRSGEATDTEQQVMEWLLSLGSTTWDALLLAMGDNVPAVFLAETLKWPECAAALADGLGSLARCRHSHPGRSKWLSVLAAAVKDKSVSELVSVIQMTAKKWQVVPAQLSQPTPSAPASSGIAASSQPGAVKSRYTPTHSVHNMRHHGLVATASGCDTRHLSRDVAATCNDTNDFIDLATKHPPMEPSLLQQQFLALKLTPAAPAGTTTVSFLSQTRTLDREARWLWWLELAKIGFFVKQVYGETKYWNCIALPGSGGQAVVKTGKGTLLWMSTGRVYSPNAFGDMCQLLCIVFPPFFASTASSDIMLGRMPVTSLSAAAPLDFSLGSNEILH